MPWHLGRTTASVTDDPPMRGRPLADPALAAVIDADQFWPVGGSSEGALWANGSIEVHARWIDALGLPVFDDADALVLEPLHLVDVGMPNPGAPRVLTGDPTPSLTSAAWKSQRLEMPPRGLVSVRASNITAPAGAAAIQIWYWGR